MAYKSKFPGAKIDELLTVVQTQQDNPTSILEKLSGQDIINKINSVEGSIVFTKFVDCQGGAGKTE